MLQVGRSSCPHWSPSVPASLMDVVTGRWTSGAALALSHGDPDPFFTCLLVQLGLKETQAQRVAFSQLSC